MSIDPSYRSYYFGLVHKKSKKWVDLFPLPYPWEFTKTVMGDTEYPTTLIESQVLYLAHDLFSRIRNGQSVREKWVKKLRFLCDHPDLNRERIKKEFEAHVDHFLAQLPTQADKPKTTGEYIEMALRIAESRTTSRIFEKIRTFAFSSDSVTTPSGISTDPRWRVWKALLL